MDWYCNPTNHSSVDTAQLSPGSGSVGHVTFRSISVAVSLCGLVGNGTVIWFIHLSTKRNSFFTYSLNLAIVDFLHLCFQIVFSVRQILKAFLRHCFRLPGIFMVLRFFFYFTSLGVISAISCQRCLSVLFPIWYPCHCPKHLSAIVSALLWILTFLLNILRGHACSQLYIRKTQFCPALLAATSAWAFLLFSILGASSLLLLLRVHASSQRHQPRKLYLVLLVSVLVFFVLGLPLSIIRFLTADVENETLNDICVLLSCTNSSANPAVYVLIGGLQRQRPREPLQVVLQRALGEETEDGKDGKAPPPGPLKDGELPGDVCLRGMAPMISWQ
ncbi:mas-related G-protein coupled receptor member X1-like [Camelus bactrianus]|uniref:Mas-related G-protein coupled receptor member B2-like n=1 Tax=Camelus bactrianus TaxID=9837 RepID=A0A9W3GU67_CAMBA|nr:mas-related G-protein coupled receptor member B2-like [Camelus bactrianus]